jgi:hypothetical protein
MNTSAKIEDFAGCSVVEVGERQAWPFITVYNPTTDQEARLYIDTPFTVNGVEATPEEEGTIPLLEVNMLAIVAIDRPGEGLRISFNDQTDLWLSGEGMASTAGEVWWTSPWRPS